VAIGIDLLLVRLCGAGAVVPEHVPPTPIRYDPWRTENDSERLLPYLSRYLDSFLAHAWVEVVGYRTAERHRTAAALDKSQLAVTHTLCARVGN